MAFREQSRTDGWQTYSEWIDYMREFSENIKKIDNTDEFESKLLACKTNYDRFKFIWSIQEIKDDVKEYYREELDDLSKEQTDRIRKSSSESTAMRQLGNASFKDTKYLAALKLYTQAIKYAPYPSQDSDDKSLAFALANRSAVLYALTRYRLCLLDIELAIKYGYPEESMFKLLIRKVKCLHILSVWANDVEQIKDDLKCMLKRRETEKMIKTEIKNMFTFIESAQPEDLEKDEQDVIDETAMKISNTSKTVSQAADCVEMSYHNDKGRYLMLNKDVTFGRLLIAEEPYVCNLAVQYRDEYCYNCFGRLYSCGLGCKNCSEVLFCSEECLEASEPVHSHECAGFIDLQGVLGVAYIVAHIMFKNNFGLTTFHTYTKKSSEKKTLDGILNIQPSDWPDLVYKNNYPSVLSLQDHASDYDYDAIMGYVLTATYLMIAFIDQFSVKYPSLLEESNQLVIGSIVLKHLLQLQTNLISILDQNLQSLQKSSLDLKKLAEKPVGIGIYPTVSLLNHSCVPNVLSIFHRNKFIARASKTLECGTEINYCYGPSVARNSKKDRQTRLKEQYFFTCTCDACQQGMENEAWALLCPKCDGPIITNRDLTHQCLKCKVENLIDVEDYIHQISEIRAIVDAEVDAKDKFQERITKLKNLEHKLSQIAYWKYPLFSKLKTLVSDFAFEEGNIELILDSLHEERDLCSRTHGPNSYEVLMVELKLINAKWMRIRGILTAKANDYKTTALSELKSLNQSVNSIRANLKELLASTNIPGAEASYDQELLFLSRTQAELNRYIAHYSGDVEDEELTREDQPVLKVTDSIDH